MKPIFQVTRKNALLLAFVTLVCMSLSSLVFFLTKEQIQAQARQQKQMLIAQVISPSVYDNDLLATCNPPEGMFAHMPIFHEICVAKKAGKVQAYLFETTASDGYNGAIRLLIAITPQGEVLGVRVTEQHETPGLGDKIELKYSPWILSFQHKWLLPHNERNLTSWAVKKDGGEFDQFTGATITPRAVVKQVKQAGLALLDRLNHQNQEGERENGQ